MTHEELPSWLKRLRDDLDTPGPAELRTAAQDRTLIDTVLDSGPVGVAPVGVTPDSAPDTVLDGASDQSDERVVVPLRPRLARFLVPVVVVLGTSAAAALAGRIVWDELSAPVIEEPSTDLPKGFEPKQSQQRVPSLANDSDPEPDPEQTEAEAADESSADAQLTAPDGVPRTTPTTLRSARQPFKAGEQQPSANPELKTQSPPPDLLARASRLRAQGKRVEAAAAYEEVVRQQPGTAASYVAKVSLAQLRAGQPGAAIRLLSSARAQQPGGVLQLEIARGLVRAYRARGERSLEKKELRRVLALQSTGAAAERARQRLKEMDSGRTSP